MKKRTQVTIRTRQRVVVEGLRVRCHQCGAEVTIVSPDNAAGVLQTTPAEIRGLLASGDLHAVDEPPRARKLSAATRCRPHQAKTKFQIKEKDNEAAEF